MKRQEKSETDRLSDLPDHLLLHIIQFMITKHGVQTCVLSRRWKNLWKRLTNINSHRHHFDQYNGVIFDKFVSQFLSGRDNSIPLHSISYRTNYEIPPKTNIPLELMEYATSHNVQQLEINTQIDNISNLELPPSIFNCYSLTSLTLCLRDVDNHTTTIMFPKSFNLPALNTLTLGHFTFFTSDNGYAEPFSTCNMLNKLVIVACKLQDDAQGLCIWNSKVSDLAIARINRDSNMHQVILCTPKLTSLGINGIPTTFPAPSTCNLTLLEELKFVCRYEDTDTMGEDINATNTISSKLLGLLPSIFNCASLTSLTLGLWDVHTTIMFPKSFNLPALNTLKLGNFTFFTSDNGYADPFSKCNMLNKLAIVACKLQDDAQGLCISNSKVSNLVISTINPDSNIHQVILCTPKLTSLTINGIPPTFPAPSICNLTLLEELKFDCRNGDTYTMGEDILISWLHLLAKVDIISLSFKILESTVNVLKNNGSMRAQLPSFAKVKSLVVEVPQCLDDEGLTEMVTYLLVAIGVSNERLTEMMRE
ncbi:F-box family protein [Trifolium pratense]|uniref:F-box family protein n=1 Tax=Trifolium pratense TaxID=57577 RepID=A0A2K3MXB3_TRIPR|nr:F-box family protein [Trifolium pratense]